MNASYSCLSTTHWETGTYMKPIIISLSISLSLDKINGGVLLLP
jgi:hypothetical protein